MYKTQEEKMKKVEEITSRRPDVSTAVEAGKARRHLKQAIGDSAPEVLDAVNKVFTAAAGAADKDTVDASEKAKLLAEMKLNITFVKSQLEFIEKGCEDHL